MKSTLIPAPATAGRASALQHAPEAFRQPAFDCQEVRDAMRIVVYIPGIKASGVEIEGRGADLTVTARQPQVLRVNFSSLHLEAVQRDYRLRLRLGTGFDYPNMEAGMADGVLTITLPKRDCRLATAPLRRVA